ncbi:MAG: FAD-dependent oxidoreductase [Clostridia bacterium]|nr:FAD-dependent oxidoreductase [Clostridia bacterium]
MINKRVVNIIGSGYAGIEAALFLAGHDIKVHVFSNEKMYKETGKLGGNKQTQSGDVYEKLLTKELCLLGSPLARKKVALSQENVSCIDPLLLSYGLNMINDNENIEVFDATVSEISPFEITIIATGQHTEGKMYDYLINKYGTMKCVRALPVFPIVEGIEDAFVFQRGDEFLVSLTETEYYMFVREIIRHAMEERKNNEEFRIYQNTIEDLALHYKENLRSYAMMPQRVYDGIKPYATITLKATDQGFAMQNISSNLPEYRQEAIFKMLNAFRNCKFKRYAGITKGRFVNPIHMTSEFCQSNQEKNVFFAGGVMGLGGHINSIASGLWTAMNVYKFIQRKQMVHISTDCAFGKLIQKLTQDKSTKVRPLITNDDILDSSEIIDADRFVEESYQKSVRALEKFKEDYQNGKYV